jgi:hypothetical protein
MADEARPPLDADTLRALTRAAGLALSADELAALLPPAAALHAAIDRLDAMELADTEPPHIFRLQGA